MEFFTCYHEGRQIGSVNGKEHHSKHGPHIGHKSGSTRKKGSTCKKLMRQSLPFETDILRAKPLICSSYAEVKLTHFHYNQQHMKLTAKQIPTYSNYNIRPDK
jgi:hypothetical protein